MIWDFPPLVFACPRCHTPLDSVSAVELRCPTDGLTFTQVDGIWHFLLPEREEHFAHFVREYETVRASEVRGDSSPEYYHALPFKDLSRRFSGDWQIRARSYRALIREVVAPLERFVERPLTALDLGAGSGWLSARLAKRYARALGVDLLTNATDGLGAYTNYTVPFTPIQAEFARLPLGDGQADVAIFNASFHYAERYEDVLVEALRVLTPHGPVVVMDTPVYRDPASGTAMVGEREEDFMARYGFPSNSLPSENFLTYDRMAQLSRVLGLHWDHVVPNYGLRWKLRPFLARRGGGREPAEFGLWIGARA